MRKLQYKVITPVGHCVVDTLARAKEIESVKGGRHEMFLVSTYDEPTEKDVEKRLRHVSKVYEKFGIKA